MSSLNERSTTPGYPWKRGSRRRSGFTLIELTVVLTIVLVLVGIALAVGRSVVAGGQSQATADVMRVLDNVLFEYGQVTDRNVPSEVSIQAEGQTNSLLYPLADAADVQGDLLGPGNNVIPSTAIFLATVRLEAPEAAEFVNGVDPSLTKSESINANTTTTRLQTILDAFGNPVRFVHPAWDGRYGPYYAQGGMQGGFNRDFPADSGNRALRRSYLPYDPTSESEAGRARRGDADEGICQGDRPYFYSAGPDGDPGTISDNVYLSDGIPKFPWETTEDPAFQWEGAGRTLED